MAQSDTETASTTSSPMSDSSRLSFAAGVALFMAPRGVGDVTLDQGLLAQINQGTDEHDNGNETTAATSEETEAKAPMTAEERRRRRNEKERLRVQGVKKRMERLREDLKALQQQHDSLQRELEQRMARGEHPVRANYGAAVGTIDGDEGGTEAELLKRYLALVKETEQLQYVKQSLENQLRPRHLQTTSLRTLVAVDDGYHTAPRNSQHPIPSAEIVMDPIVVLESMLSADPLTTEEAKELVEETCRDMMQMLARTDWVKPSKHSEFAGWSGDHVIEDPSVLHFRLSQRFKNVGARELMQKTWTLLTNVEEYRQIQPTTSQLKVLQRLNDECWVVGIAVGTQVVRHSLVLVARALIHGGYLITFRSLPLLRRGQGGSEHARQRFIEIETGGMYVNTYSWYNFQERANDKGGVDCEVIFGGSARNGDTHYLQQLKIELLSGITRWQSAVGFSRAVFLPMLEQEEKQEQDDKWVR